MNQSNATATFTFRELDNTENKITVKMRLLICEKCKRITRFQENHPSPTVCEHVDERNNDYTPCGGTLAQPTKNQLIREALRWH